MEETFAQRIKLLIKHYDLSQTKLATGAGLTHQTVKNILDGSVPRYDTLVALLRYFSEISTSWLVLGEGKMFADSDRGNVVEETGAHYGPNHEMMMTMWRKDRDELEMLRTMNKELTNKLLDLNRKK